MALTPTYNYQPEECPAIQTPATALYYGADPPTPTTRTSIDAGSSAAAQGLPTRLNRNAVRDDIQGRYGGGIYAVAWGLQLAAGSGLNLSISAGQAMLDGPVEVRSTQTLALVDNLLSRVWISRSGALAAVTEASADPLAPPTSSVPWAYLGAAQTGGGAITALDYSGRLVLDQGNLALRECRGDGVPDDAPPTTVRFLHRNSAGLWLWDGADYYSLGQSTSSSATAAAAEDTARDLESLERRFRRMLTHYVLLLGGIPPGLERDFAAGVAELDAPL